MIAVIEFIAVMCCTFFTGPGGAVIGSVVPFTFIAIMPTNHRLLDPGRDLALDETRKLLEKWGRLHAVRSTLGLVASVIYLVSLLMA
jgi:Domain of unknown function (DUF1772)